ncbi:MFS transporter [Patellaria atrata CBS 101060]|uniref:MFS transporter n=1 Tax=Patellaria atrata CBS 101060 TaxID=1346257 RepID=A0A9P4SII4_9PEZI|nr:MFS transporter [Patellaria atrata CBS 101060]
MYWGGLSDRVGRKPVLLFGCFGTLLSLLVVGLAPNFWIALLGRILGGLLNGNIGVIQTMVGELVGDRKEHEPKAYAVMPFVWSIGTIIGPSIGGYFAEPRDNFPSVISSKNIFAIFPYLLPNLICALMLFVSIIAGYLFLDETHPDMQPWSTAADLDNTAAETPLLPAAGSTAHAPANLTAESYGTFDSVAVEEHHTWHVRSDGRPLSVKSDASSAKEKVFTRQVVMLVIALGIFTYHSMTYDHLLPIFFQDEWKEDISAMIVSGKFAGGLGMSVQQVGVIMSLNGIIAMFIQAVVFPIMASWLGVWRLFVLVTVGHPIAYFVVPYLVVVPYEWLYTAVYTCLTIRNFFSIIAYPLLLILLKEASPGPSYLGKINGLAASTGAACRTIACPIAGIIYGIGSRIDFTALAWWVSAIVAIVGAGQVAFIQQQQNKTTHVRSAVPCIVNPQEIVKHEVIHIAVDDVERPGHTDHVRVEEV